MRLGTIVCLVTFIVGAVLAVLQLWFEPLPADVFVKLLITLGVFFVVVLGTMLATREYLEDQKLRDSGYID